MNNSISATCKCGVSPCEGDTDDDEWHKQVHDEYLFGAVIPEFQNLPTIASKGDLRLCVVTVASEALIRQAAADFAMVAQRFNSTFGAGYYGTDTEVHSRLFVLLNNTHSVGMAVSSNAQKFRRISLKPERVSEIADENTETKEIHKISRIWIAETYRRQGWAAWLVVEIGKYLACSIQDIGWELPLTESGRSLVKSICLNEFLGCGKDCN